MHSQIMRTIMQDQMTFQAECAAIVENYDSYGSHFQSGHVSGHVKTPFGA